MFRGAAHQPIERSDRVRPARCRLPRRLSTVLIGMVLAGLAGPAPAVAARAGETITVAVPSDHAPWSSAADGGVPRGIVVDLWREWERATGTPVAFVILPEDRAVGAVQAGEVDVLGGVVATGHIAGLDATDDLLHVPIEAYIRAGTGITSLESLTDVFVGIVAGHDAITAAMEHHTEIAIVSFPDTAALYRAVADGTLDAFADESGTARRELARVGALGEFDRVTPPVAVIGFRAYTAAPEMRDRIDAGMGLVGGETRRAILDRWTLADPRRVDAGLATVLLLGIMAMAGLAVHSLTVRRQVRHRTAALEASRNELAAMNERLRAQATHDLLTGLANRRLFVERIGQAIAAARRNGDRVGVLYLDLDDFKTINDRWGHGVGDGALTAIADRIRACVRQADTPARLGGDEFAVLVDRVDGFADARAIAAKLAAACSRPLEVGTGEHRIGASIGIALFPDDGQDADALLAAADRRMYLAKMRAKGLEFVPRAAAPRGTGVVVTE